MLLYQAEVRARHEQLGRILVERDTEFWEREFVDPARNVHIHVQTMGQVVDGDAPIATSSGVGASIGVPGSGAGGAQVRRIGHRGHRHIHGMRGFRRVAIFLFGGNCGDTKLVIAGHAILGAHGRTAGLTRIYGASAAHLLP